MRDSSWTTFSDRPTHLTINGDHGRLVTISLSDGSLEFGENYKPSEAAEAFWLSVSAEYGRFLKWKRTEKST